MKEPHTNLEQSKHVKIECPYCKHKMKIPEIYASTEDMVLRCTHPRCGRNIHIIDGKEYTEYSCPACLLERSGGTILYSKTPRKITLRRPPVVAIDLDGVIAEYDLWRGEEHFGKPKPRAREALKKLKELGCTITIWTTRRNTKAVEKYLKEHDIPFDFINESPLPPGNGARKIRADVYIDDRAVPFINWTQALKDTLRKIREKRR